MMISVATCVIALVTAYLIGSFPTSYLLTRMMSGIDIRAVGSGNAGATNVLRTVGKIPAILTLVIDILKGIIVVTFISRLFYSFGIDLVFEFFQGLMGLTVVCGHIWSVFLKLKGGKGVATTLGVGLGITPLAIVPTLIVWLAVFSLSKYVSLASIIALVSFPVACCVIGYDTYTILFAVIICSIAIVKHKDNVRRLLQGAENKTQIFKKR